MCFGPHRWGGCGATRREILRSAGDSGPAGVRTGPWTRVHGGHRVGRLAMLRRHLTTELPKEEPVSHTVDSLVESFYSFRDQQLNFTVRPPWGTHACALLTRNMGVGGRTDWYPQCASHLVRTRWVHDGGPRKGSSLACWRGGCEQGVRQTFLPIKLLVAWLILCFSPELIFQLNVRNSSCSSLETGKILSCPRSVSPSTPAAYSIH